MTPSSIHDVAKLAGVSTATVSRVLNGSEQVSPKTREKVLQVCEQLNYSLNPLAQRLRLGRTKTVATILPFLTLPSIVERLRGVQAALADSGYDLIPVSVGTPQARDARLLEFSQKLRTDGVLVLCMPVKDSQVRRFLENEVPIVLVDAQHEQLNRVNVDDRLGGRLATQHLLELGHTRIGFISSHIENPFQFCSTKARYDGYSDALLEYGLEINTDYQRQAEHGRDEAHKMALELLHLPTPPTAIFASSDTKAIGVLDAARELGIKVPQQLSVIGYDDIRDAEYVNLTTIQQPLFDSGLEGGRKILSMINTPSSSPVEIMLPLKLIVRGTTAPPA